MTHRLLVVEHFANKRIGLFNKQKKGKTETTYFECKETNDYSKSEINDRLNQPDETPN